MTYEELVRNKVIESYEVDSEEIASKIKDARHDIGVAQEIKGIDLDWAYGIAYNGIREIATAYAWHLGYRPRGVNKHYNTFKFLEVALPDRFQKEVGLMQKIREKRHQIVYDSRGIISETEAKDVIAFSQQFLKEIMDLLPKKIMELSEQE